MDPIAHTLFGATLAETRLKALTHLAIPALILGANAPDIDAITMLVDRDLSLGFRRGWTHGVIAMFVLPAVLTVLLLLFDRISAKVLGQAPRAKPGFLFLLSFLAVLSHPLLDWLNTYGVRLLMPFDSAWFYGDALFIVDPWVWLLMSATVVLAHSRSQESIGAWLLLGVVLTVLITSFAGAPVGTRLLWCVGVAVISWFRWKWYRTKKLDNLARACLGIFAVYIIAMVGLSYLAEKQVVEWMLRRDDSPVTIMVSPTPGNPFRWDIVVSDRDHYHFLVVDWLAGQTIRISRESIERGPTGPVVQAALTAPEVQGMATWMRFPIFAVKQTVFGYRVSIRDARYASREGAALGSSVVELDHHLRVR